MTIKATQPSFCLDLKQTELAWQAILQARSIGLISHRNPDPDTIGSNLSLKEVLTGLGKQVQSICLDPLPQMVRFLPGSENFSPTLDPEQFDLLMSVDCGSTAQTACDKQFPEIFSGNYINIDHHASNTCFGRINLVNPKMSSTSEIIYNLIQHWSLRLTPLIATYLLAGLYYDTGSFMHPNTTPEVLQMAEDLYRHGANHQLVIRHLYQNFSLSKFHLWGETLSSLKVTPQNSVVAVVTPENLEHNQAKQEELNGVISYLSTVKGNDFAVLINQDQQGQIKGSIRTNHNHINVSEIAESLGGGGHKKASGFGFPGHLTKEVVWKVVNQ
jgi:phosphoesterase RecJ-like protein